MTQEKLIDAITDLDSDILNRYFDMKADLAAKKKPKKRTWVKWASIAACFCLIFTIGIMVLPMFHNNPNSGDFDNAIHYASIQDVEQVIGTNTLLSNVLTDRFEYVGYDLHYLDGKDKLPTVLEGLYSIGTSETTESIQIFCSFPQYRGEMSNIDHFLPSSVLPPDFPDKGETETVVPPTLLSTTVKGVEVFFYQYEQGEGLGGLGKFEVNGHIYIVKAFSPNNENLLFDVISEMLTQE